MLQSDRRLFTANSVIRLKLSKLSAERIILAKVGKTYKFMIFLYVTCKDVDEAKKIGRALVEKKIAGCVNIAPIRSIYPENGEVREVEEASLIVKTIDSKVQLVEDTVRALHSYKVPCIASFSLHRLNHEYKNWLVSCVA